MSFSLGKTFHLSVGTGFLCVVTFCLTMLNPAGMTQQPLQLAADNATPAAAITLDEAIARARSNEPTFAAAMAASRNAELDRSIARSALLPSVTYNNQYLYTQPLHGATESGNASTTSPAVVSPPRFIANNSVHEYTSQGEVSEVLGAAQFNAVSRASASLAIATAELEVARRGLVASVASLFYASSTADRRVAIAQRAADDAASLTTLTQQRESAREVARADVVKAQLQQQQRDRDVADAKLQAEKSRLDLAVLLFADPRTPYRLSVPDAPERVPARADVEAALARRNPELESALASTHLADLNVLAARAQYLPDLALNYTYGIDAAQFAAHDYGGAGNLGYSASVTFDIPVWDWFATHDRVRQSEITRDAARAALTNTQRKLIATLEEDYDEAVAAHDQLDSLELSVNTAAESLRMTRLRYSAGESTILEVVDAENSLTSSEIAREDGVVRCQTALANLQLLTGTI
ncbi:MAG: TolC family protein [Acidobacteriaceae bacterium]|jgi:outer membrane protein TolC